MCRILVGDRKCHVPQIQTISASHIFRQSFLLGLVQPERGKGEHEESSPSTSAAASGPGSAAAPSTSAAGPGSASARERPFFDTIAPSPLGPPVLLPANCSDTVDTS